MLISRLIIDPTTGCLENDEDKRIKVMLKSFELWRKQCNDKKTRVKKNVWEEKIRKSPIREINL